MHRNNNEDKVPDVSIDEALSMFLKMVAPQVQPEDAAQSELFGILKDRIARDRPAWAKASGNPGETVPVPESDRAESYSQLKHQIALKAVQEPVPEDPEERYFYHRRKEARENRLKKVAEENEASRRKTIVEQLIQQKNNSSKVEKTRLDLLRKILAERIKDNTGPEFSHSGTTTIGFSEKIESSYTELLNRFKENPPQDEWPPDHNLLNEFGEVCFPESNADLVLDYRTERNIPLRRTEQYALEKNKTARSEQDFPPESTYAEQTTVRSQYEEPKAKPEMESDGESPVISIDKQNLEFKHRDLFDSDTGFILSLDRTMKGKTILENNFSTSSESRRKKGLTL